MSAKNGPSARNGPSAVAAPSTSVVKSRPAVTSTSSTTSTTTTASKYVKNTATPGQQHKQLTSPTSSGGTSSFFQQTSSSKTQADAAAAKDPSSSKLARRESVKAKTSDNGNRKSIFGWFKQHIVDDGAKSSAGAGAGSGSSSSSRGTKKKLETAASFARAHATHLSDSMPSLVLQLGTSGPEMSTTSSSSITSTSNANTGVSGTGDAIKYRLKKNPVTMSTSDSGSDGASRTKSSLPVRNMSGRNRWSSYDISGAAGLGLPLVTVEDSDESAAGDDDERRSISSMTAPHHLLGARSVEALYVGGVTGHNQLATNASQQHPSSDVGLSTNMTINAPIVITTSGSVAVTSRRGRGTEDELIEKLRVIDERIVKARDDRNHLIAQLLDIPHGSFDKVVENKSSKSSDVVDRNHRELLLTSLKEVDRLTSCIGDILRMTESTNGKWPSETTRNDPTATHSNNDSVNRRVHGNEKNNRHCYFSADHSSVRVFLEIGVRLQQQLSQLKKSMVDDRVDTNRANEAPPSEQVETKQQTFGERVILASHRQIDPPGLEQSVSDNELSSDCPSENIVQQQKVSSTKMSPGQQIDTISEVHPVSGNELSSVSGCPSETIVLEQSVSSNGISQGGPIETTSVELPVSINEISPGCSVETNLQEQPVSGNELSSVSSGSPSEIIVLEQLVSSNEMLPGDPIETISVEHPVLGNQLSSGCSCETIILEQPMSINEISSGDIVENTVLEHPVSKNELSSGFSADTPATITEQSVTSPGRPIEITVDPPQLHSSDVIVEL